MAVSADAEPPSMTEASGGPRYAVYDAPDPRRAHWTRRPTGAPAAAPLSERQARHLDEWGDPFVFEDYRFHMTL